MKMNDKCKIYVSNTESFYTDENVLKDNWKDLSVTVFKFDNDWMLQSKLEEISVKYQYGVIEGFNSKAPAICTYINLKEG